MRSKYFFIFFLLVIVMQAGCNKASIFEGVDKNGWAANNGSLTMYTYTVLRCGPLKIYVDDRLMGTLAADYTGSTPACGTPSSGSILTITVGEGFHTIRAEGSGSNCTKTYTRVYVENGKCVNQPLNF